MLVRVGPKQNAHNEFGVFSDLGNVRVSYMKLTDIGLSIPQLRPFPFLLRILRERQKINLKTQMFKLKMLHANVKLNAFTHL